MFATPIRTDYTATALPRTPLHSRNAAPRDVARRVLTLPEQD